LGELSAALIAPTLRVDAEGKVLEVEGSEELRRQTAERIAAASPQAPREPSGSRGWRSPPRS
jgi:hypothetical protein